MIEHAQPKGERALLSETLILASLALTGKTMEDISIRKKIYGKGTTWKKEISIEKFSYYILSPEFIEKYQENCINDFESYTDIVLSELFGRALYLYQSGNEKHLIELLSKIGN